MKAIVVRPGEHGSIHMRDMPDPRMKPDQVAVKMLRVGLCATDAEIAHGLYGKPPNGEELLILGHENVGVVADVGARASGFKPGDVVVSTVRRPCAVCRQCRAGENDMCSSGEYTERGIMRLHGFMAQYYVESPRYLIKIPKALRDIGVLLEPMSIVEKGIDHAFALQRRLVWKPEVSLVLGAGPIGLLAASVLRARGLRTVVASREDPADRRAQVVRELGAEYVSTLNCTLADVVRATGAPDILVEATGNGGIVFDAMQILGPNGVLCLLSVTAGETVTPEPIDLINRRLVIGNQVVFGSVNANPRHFVTGIKDLSRIEKAHPGVLRKLLTHPIPWEDYAAWFSETRPGIKSTLEIA
jgi:threonine dehydrogenase-like Zn-dependent dehydrogenase